MTDDDWNARDYSHHARFVSDLSQEVMQDLSPKRGETILDLGCGNGVLTRRIMDCDCTVIGIDASPSSTV